MKLLSGCLLEQNSANDAGGALAAHGTKVSLENVTFFENIGQDNGGAVYLLSGAHVDVLNSRFIDNSANYENGAGEYGGGAILVRSSTLNVQNSSFEGNLGRYNNLCNPLTTTCQSEGGGALYILKSSTVKIEHSTFRRNNAGDDALDKGGAIFFSGRQSTLLLKECTFEGNSALLGGGYDLYVKADVEDGAVVIINAIVETETETEIQRRGGFEFENPLALAQCGGSVSQPSSLCGSLQDRCANRTISVYDTRGPMMVNVALERPTRSYTTGANSLTSLATVDGLYGLDARFFTVSDDGLVVVPASASASRSSIVDGGKFLSSLSLASATMRTGWEDSLDQSDVYCIADLRAKETSRATTHGLDTVEKRRAAGFREYEGDTIDSCKLWCEEFSGCIGISYKSGGPSYPCILVTLSSWPCSQQHSAWSTHWYV